MLAITHGNLYFKWPKIVFSYCQTHLKAIRLAPLNLKVNLKYLLYFFVNISKVKTYIKKINILRLNKPES